VLFAIVRLNTFDPDRLANARQDVEEFDALHAGQPGYVGSMVVDLDQGRRLVINVWQSKEHSEAALAVLAPQVGRLLNPLMTAPSQFLGAGVVISADLPSLRIAEMEQGPPIGS
jgi:hypothetical protein